MTDLQIVALTVSEATRLTELEGVVARGLATFVDVGNALAAIRDARLYRAAHGTFEEYLQARWGMARRTAYQMIDAATVVENVRNCAQIAPANESQARPLARLEPDEQRAAWGRVVETAPDGKVTAAHVQAVVDEMTTPEPDDDGEAEWQFNREQILEANRQGAMIQVPKRPPQLHVADDSYEWYTPTEYIEAARAVMGGIDLDPASCEVANGVVQAAEYYDAQADGLHQVWRGNVWLNPPYNMPWIENFVDKALAAYRSGACPQAIILTNNSTDTGWFHKLMSAGPFCLTRGRIRFWGESGDVLATRQGQAIFYLGPNVERFVSLFAGFGMIVEAIGDDSQ